MITAMVYRKGLDGFHCPCKSLRQIRHCKLCITQNDKVVTVADDARFILSGRATIFFILMIHKHLNRNFLFLIQVSNLASTPRLSTVSAFFWDFLLCSTQLFTHSELFILIIILLRFSPFQSYLLKVTWMGPLPSMGKISSCPFISQLPSSWPEHSIFRKILDCSGSYLTLS